MQKLVYSLSKESDTIQQKNHLTQPNQNALSHSIYILFTYTVSKTSFYKVIDIPKNKKTFSCKVIIRITDMIATLKWKDSMFFYTRLQSKHIDEPRPILNRTFRGKTFA